MKIKLLIKNIGLPLLFLLAISCADDDPLKNISHEPVSQNILGRWYLQGGTVNGGEFIAYNGNACEDFGNYQEFLSTGELNYVGYGQDCRVNETITSQYSITDTTLRVSGSSQDDRVFIIESLTSGALKLKRTHNGPEGGITEVAYFIRN